MKRTYATLQKVAGKLVKTLIKQLFKGKLKYLK
jgi:hypothetical protein